MKKFTIKDFLFYNNPCFSCQSNINFYFVSNSKDISKTKQPGYFNPIVSKDAISIDIKKSYSHSLTLSIYNKTNKFYANNKHELEAYLDDHRISMYSTCPKCNTTIISNTLEFDVKGKFVKPVEVFAETINVESKGKTYSLATLIENNSSHIEVINGSKTSLTSMLLLNNDSFSLDIPALPLYKFKNKDNLIKKIGIYMTFS